MTTSAATPCWQQPRGKKSKVELKNCELQLVEHQAQALDNIMKKEAASNQTLLRVFVIVRAFLVKRRRVCYGGTAMNCLIPKKYQFYGDADIPDYDVYSDTPIQDAKEMVDVLRKSGIINSEAKAGIHIGTFKVFANGVAVLDVTEMPGDMFDALQATAVSDPQDGLLYANPAYLRFSVHIELSRPMGDVSRWHKITQRLALLDAAYPFEDQAAHQQVTAALREVHARWPLPGCAAKMGSSSSSSSSNRLAAVDAHAVVNVAITALAAEGAVFFGAIACRIYQEMDDEPSSAVNAPAPAVQIDPIAPCVDALVHSLAEAGGKLVSVLCGGGKGAVAAAIATAMTKSADDNACQIICTDATTGCHLVLYRPLQDIISWRLEYMTPDGRRLLAVYETNACHAYNEIAITHALWTAVLGSSNIPVAKKLRLANLDVAVCWLGPMSFAPSMQRLDALETVRTMLTMFGRHTLDQTGPWARFKLPCLGDQHGLAEMRQEKVEKMQEFKKKGVNTGPEYERWFLKYAPAESNKKKKQPRVQRQHSKRIAIRGSSAMKTRRRYKSVRQRRGSSSSSSGTRQSFLQKIFK